MKIILFVFSLLFIGYSTNIFGQCHASVKKVHISNLERHVNLLDETYTGYVENISNDYYTHAKITVYYYDKNNDVVKTHSVIVKETVPPKSRTHFKIHSVSPAVWAFQTWNVAVTNIECLSDYEGE